MEHETHHHGKKKTKIKIGSWIGIVGVILLIIISFQLAGANRNLAMMNTKLGTLEEFFNQIDEVNTGSANEQARNQPTPSAQANAPSVDMVALIDDDDIKGDKDAPVTIVEFSDFECPFCTRFYQQTLSQIDEQYIKTGKVKFIYRDFPLSFHPNAQKAGEATECAGEQGKFWEMHDVLFDKGVKGGVESFKTFAQDLDLDTSKFNECLDSGAMASEVQKDFRDGQAAGITGTPGFIINGKKVSGALPFENFKQIIEAELGQ